MDILIFVQYFQTMPGQFLYYVWAMFDLYSPKGTHTLELQKQVFLLNDIFMEFLLFRILYFQDYLVKSQGYFEQVSHLKTMSDKYCDPTQWLEIFND